MTLNPIVKHRIYQNIRDIVKKALPGSLVQDSYLHLEIPLQNGQSEYQFAINSTETYPQKRGSENRLNNNDAFCACEGGIFIKNEDQGKPGSANLETYPNVQVFAPVANELATADLEAVYNSKLSIKVGDITYADGISMRECRNVRTTQQASATTKSEQLGDDGLIALEPVITFDGSDKNVVTVKIPTWAGQLIQYATGNNRVYLVLRFKGFLVTGGSKLATAGGLDLR